MPTLAITVLVSHIIRFCFAPIVVWARGRRSCVVVFIPDIRVWAYRIWDPYNRWDPARRRCKPPPWDIRKLLSFFFYFLWPTAGWYSPKPEADRRCRRRRNHRLAYTRDRDYRFVFRKTCVNTTRSDYMASEVKIPQNSFFPSKITKINVIFGQVFETNLTVISCTLFGWKYPKNR